MMNRLLSSAAASRSIIAFISFLFTMIFDILLTPLPGISVAAVALGISSVLSSLITVFAIWRVFTINTAKFLALVRSMIMDYKSVMAPMPLRLGV